MPNKKLKKVLGITYDLFFFSVIFIMLVSAFIFFISSKSDKSFLGYRFYEVLTNSMKKTEATQQGNFVAGDLIIVKVEKPDEFGVGDIITFTPNSKSPETFLTHRIKRIEEEGIASSNNEDQEQASSKKVFITQGDANNKEDPPVSAENVIGKVQFSIPKAANFINFIRRSPFASGIFAIAFFLILYLVKGYFIASNVSGGKKHVAGTTSQSKKRKRRKKSQKASPKGTSRKRKRKKKPRSKST